MSGSTQSGSDKKRMVVSFQGTTSGDTLTTNNTKRSNKGEDEEKCLKSGQKPKTQTMTQKISKGGACKVMEHSSASTGSNNCTASSKLSKLGQRLRDSCRNLRAKHSSGGRASHNPQDYTSIQSPAESFRSKHYVPMDFSGKEGRIVDYNDLPGNGPIKDGYTYFRRKCHASNAKNLLTETQSTIHLEQPWFHKKVGRDLSQRILATHAIDGSFMVRNSSVAGGFVISYYYSGKTYHAQALPDIEDGIVTYSIDDFRTRFFDLLQMVEFYQLNRGSLHHKLTHFIINVETAKALNYNVRSVDKKTGGCTSSKETSSDDNQERKTKTAVVKPTSPESSSSDVGLPSSNSSLASGDEKFMTSTAAGREGEVPEQTQTGKDRRVEERNVEPEKPKFGNSAIRICNGGGVQEGGKIGERENNNYKKGSNQAIPQSPLGDSQESNKGKSVTTRDENTAIKSMEDKSSSNLSDKEN